MTKKLLLAESLVGAAVAPVGVAQVQNFKPVTKEMLLNPSPNDWLMFSRTYDGQRYSPLTQINKRNVGTLPQSWTRGLGSGTLEAIPNPHTGLMHVLGPQ